MAGVLTGSDAFAPVQRFDVATRRVRTAATLPGEPVLFDELTAVVDDACDGAALTSTERAECPLFLAVHSDSALPRSPYGPAAHGTDAYASRLAERTGLSDRVRAYTSACVAATTAVADAAAMIARGDAKRIVVAAGYLVEPDQYALFDAGRALAVDGRVRPFSRDRRGLLLGDGVAAIVVEAAGAGTPLARLAGWGRAGDAHHPCHPHPEGTGLARAVTSALHRASVRPDQIGYLNAHGSGTAASDSAEAAGLHTALGEAAEHTPVSSTKSLIGQSLEAAGLLELIVTMYALRDGKLPVNAGYLGADDACRLDVILGEARATTSAYALSVNAAFGGANTALLVGAA
jgi:3-oxoacyl-[acyl-carrier-protein] synthase II